MYRNIYIVRNSYRYLCNEEERNHVTLHNICVTDQHISD